MATVVLLVVLRLTVGWHFLYEGVWKIMHPDEFAAEAEGFLTGARGPLAGMFYAMVPDIDGRARLDGELGSVDEVVKDKDGKVVKDAAGQDKTVKKPVVRNAARTARWEALRDRLVAKHPQVDDAAQKVYEQQLLGAEKYLGENRAEIEAYFNALARFDEAKKSKSNPHTAFQIKRDWDSMKKLRG
jgi:hypothetical protein